MQYRHPMHLSLSITTMPSSRRLVAPVGHTFSHSGSSQCMQVIGRKCIRLSGYLPVSYFNTRFHTTPLCVEFIALHAMVHVSQPMHLLRSITMPYLVMVPSCCPALDIPSPGG